VENIQPLSREQNQDVRRTPGTGHGHRTLMSKKRVSSERGKFQLGGHVYYMPSKTPSGWEWKGAHLKKRGKEIKGTNRSKEPIPEKITSSYWGGKVTLGLGKRPHAQGRTRLRKGGEKQFKKKGLARKKGHRHSIQESRNSCAKGNHAEGRRKVRIGGQIRVNTPFRGRKIETIGGVEQGEGFQVRREQWHPKTLKSTVRERTNLAGGLTKKKKISHGGTAQFSHPGGGAIQPLGGKACAETL